MGSQEVKVYGFAHGNGSVRPDGLHAANGAAAPVNGLVPRNGSAGPNGSADGSGSARVRAYEELDGAEGRAVFFRPHRYTAADLAPLLGVVTLSTAGVVHRCELVDVSQNGVAFALPPDVPVELRQALRVVLHFDTHEAFRGDVHVGSVREHEGSTLVGASFDDFLLDVDELLELRNVQRWKAERGGVLVPEASWRVPGSDRFKALVAELRLVFEDAQQHLGALENELPWHVLHGTANPARAALVAALHTDFVAEVVATSEAIDAAVRELPGGHGNVEAREWSLRHLQSFLMQSPGLHRARHKPFGYPGDYEVMNFIYERYFEGATLFARAVGLAFSEAVSSKAVRSRKDLVARQLKSLLLARAGTHEPIRVLSIASGPAQELFEVFQDLEELPARVEIVLFEQDKNALAHAWRKLKSGVESRFHGQVRLTFLHDSIKRLLRDRDLFAAFGKFDLIYSCGLSDYLQDHTTVRLTRNLAASTARGGRLLVANMVDHSARWLLEQHLDWPLIYRTREQLLAIGRQAVPEARVCLLEEESGVNPFLEVVRE